MVGRNPTAITVGDFASLLRWARESGERLVRIHLRHGRQAVAAAGEVDEAWAAHWDRVFAEAGQNDLCVLPVFGVWADWNDGSKSEPWRDWRRNPFNAAAGGPARAPGELMGDTPCRKLWLGWLEKLVRRWQTRANILGWEIFSELDLVTGTTEAAAVGFVERAARVIGDADARRRPVTASMSGICDWPKLSRSAALDFIQVHPYADDPRARGNLDELILSAVRDRLRQYDKPVFIGECGLDSRAPKNTLTVSPRAHIGIRHAIWAAAVSGAMNGRMLWWEDGYDRYSGLDLRARHADASRPVARFVKDVDFAGFGPLMVKLPAELKGAAIGNGRVVLGWVRDAQCAAPDWPVRRIEGQRVLVAVPGIAADWRVTFHDTATGEMTMSTSVRRETDGLNVALPALEGFVAFKLTASERARP